MKNQKCCLFIFFVLLAALCNVVVAQRPETETASKLKTLEGTLWTAPSKSSFAVESKQREFYTLAPAPNQLTKYGEVDWKNVEAVWVLGEVDTEQKTVRPAKIQVKIAGTWKNLEPLDFANKLICDDKICRNCKVKCGGTCKCSKWAK